jgi:ATP-dependent Lhr-like helicase
MPEESVLRLFHPAVRRWFAASFSAPTLAQQLCWPAIARGDSTLLLAPTGSGKTLAAFLWSIERTMFSPPPAKASRCRVLYISPLKALAVDVERNLRLPLAGIAAEAAKEGGAPHEPAIFVRTGDTPAAERSRFVRAPADILITTPESLYLMLTSQAREALRSVETVIVDEIHALAPTKRGSHLALSLERLERLCGRRLQRIGLSATQRPLDEMARFLGGVEEFVRQGAEDGVAEDEFAEAEPRYRPVTVLDASAPKPLQLTVRVPVEDMSKLAVEGDGQGSASIWSSIHPELLELVRAHRSTLIFVNSRRLAERISGALNELAGETLVLAHHGSVAPEQRKQIEERLKRGEIKGLVATSSLELGIDMGAIDLVAQIEAPPSVASGVQRIGRAGHQVGAESSGIIFPKFRADLLACAAAARAMQQGRVEAVRYPRNPLDVLAQQVVAAVAVEATSASKLYELMRRAAPFAKLTRESFESVLDLLSGRYPSDEFAELRPRITWDRTSGRLSARESALHIAIANGGTIPDRGLYGVYLAGAAKPTRLGELDEEMVHESKPGDVIILGASSWRVDEITHERVMVLPAAGEPGRMPFWHGDGVGRPVEFGRGIGALARELMQMPAPAALERLEREHALEPGAAENLLRFLREQATAARVPSDEEILIERCRDEMGDWRICVLSPFGSRVHAPWCMAVAAALRDELGLEPETIWADDGFVVRLPETESPPETALFLPRSESIYDRVVAQLGATSLFAARFRENAARALLLPRRRRGARTPLWRQRKRAADLLNVASRYPSFPILVESYRECIRDIFDLPALTSILAGIERGAIRVSVVDSEKPSPFAASLLFGYAANYIYDGDAPLAERRAQALSIDPAQLQQLLGEADFRELLDLASIHELEKQLQWLGEEQAARSADALHDMLLRLGDLSTEELRQRCEGELSPKFAPLLEARRVLPVTIAGGERMIAVEHAAQYRDALGVELPEGLAATWLEAQMNPLLELASRYARTHGPFTLDDLLRRYALPRARAEETLGELVRQGRLLEGGFRPGGSHREWVHPEVLQQLRRRTLARLRRQVEPLAPRALGAFLPRWQGVGSKRHGAEALLDAIETLQGVALPLSELEREILPARIAGYDPAELDALMAAGEVVWVGRGSLGEHDGNIALYLVESLASLLPPEAVEPSPPLEGRGVKIAEFLAAHGASFFAAVHEGAGGGYPGETSDALWELVWQGVVTNDAFHPLRSYLHPERDGRLGRGPQLVRPGSPEFLRQFRLRAKGGALAQGRWALVRSRVQDSPTVTEWSTAISRQLLLRYGLVTREAAAAEELRGGFSTIYPALRQMEERGWIRRGMFLAGMGGSQFAMNAAVDSLRALRPPARPEGMMLAAVDPANPYGTLLPWPRTGAEAHGMARVSGAGVVLVEGELAAFLRRGNSALKLMLPEAQPERDEYARAAARELAHKAAQRTVRDGLLISEINGVPAAEHFFGAFLREAGFVLTAQGYQMRRDRNTPSDSGIVIA